MSLSLAGAGGKPEVREKAIANFNSTIAAGRIGNPLEAGEVIPWLCSGAASYVTGHSMIADSGSPLASAESVRLFGTASGSQRTEAVYAKSAKRCMRRTEQTRLSRQQHSNTKLVVLFG